MYSQTFEEKVLGQFKLMDQRFEKIDQKLENQDTRLENIDTRLENIDTRLENQNKKLESQGKKLENHDTLFNTLINKLVGIEYKLDQKANREEIVQFKDEILTGQDEILVKIGTLSLEYMAYRGWKRNVDAALGLAP